MPGTVHLHRVFTARPERVYRAFLEPDAMVQWLPPYGFTASIEGYDARPGGRFRMSFRNFGSGTTHSFGGEFLELVPHSLIRYTDEFDDPNLPGTIEVTVKITAVSCGTEVHVEQRGIPDLIPPEQCYLGWQESLEKLARLVNPDIPG
ncbi:MAG: SRPBCC family protein [Beijerinckiaceae bacterium]|jgi:uncharacterized protein YndB with AHSA1/START domain|nr:SRPBCC family protein [Beijerinckiaceae bacterium]